MAGEPSSQAVEVDLVPRVEAFLKAKDDTSRFAGLSLLEICFERYPEVREDPDTITRLWKSISPKFLDRLMKTGEKQGEEGQKMMKIAINVIYTFVSLLPDQEKRESRLTNRIPLLVSSILHCSEETTRLATQTLTALTSFPEGATVFVGLEDISPLTEVATSQPDALKAIAYAWLTSAERMGDKSALRRKIDQTVQSLVVCFRGTDAVTLLDFLALVFRNADPEIIPQNPKWLDAVVVFIRNLVTSRPTAEARSAYTNLTASLLQVYPAQAPKLLFASQPSSGQQRETPLSYLLVNLLLIDIRSSCPTLLEKLNSPEYGKTSYRLGSAYDVVSSFLGFLVRSLDSEDEALPVSPDLLLKLRKSISETMSVTAEYLRDRWDASVAGAMGLHPDARAGKAETSMGSRFTLAWDSAQDNASEDPFILAAVRALAIWLREDENDLLRKEACGLMDMFMDLYRSSSSGKLDFRLPVLVALEGITAMEKGIEAFLNNNGWRTLTSDLLKILELTSREGNESECTRGIEIVRILLAIVESEQGGIREDWMDLITAVAAWDTPDTTQPPVVQEFQVAVLQLSSSLLAKAGPGMCRRYVHSTTAILGIARQLRRNIPGDSPLILSLEDAVATLDSLR